MMNDEETVRALWRRQSSLSLQLTPAELRVRAQRFDAQARRRERFDQVSFALLAGVFSAGAVWMVSGGPLTRFGCGLLALWALWCLYGRQRFASVLPAPSDPAVSACALHYRWQLVRQRDLVASWPLGIALGAPGFFVYCLGLPFGPKHMPWTMVIALLGVGSFAGIYQGIQGKILAGRWQQEIDGLDALSVAEAPAADTR